jgi:tRNA(Arg) A34 adenosine deaminase TadA
MYAGHDAASLLGRLLDVVQQDIIPLTRKGVARGNKIFGAAILRKSDLSVVVAETNNELENPLWHGEMHAIKRLFESIPQEQRLVEQLLFLSTHEPCSMCLSAITWAGFDNFYYLFSHTDSRDSFAIPHDLKILKEVFTLDPGGYRSRNAFWTSHSIIAEINALEEGEDRSILTARATTITGEYTELSQLYQSSKPHNNIPLP